MSFTLSHSAKKALNVLQYAKMMEKLVKPVIRKTFKIRESGRSSDYISPSFGYGCLLNCSYCYMKRHKPEGLDYARNIGDILTEINTHAYFFADVEKPNQTDPEYITYDISCNEDFALHHKYYNWEKIFQFFVDHPKAKATFATKVIPEAFLKFNPKEKVRIRFSLMPQSLKEILEPNTPDIHERIRAVNKFIEAGYDVHLNFSPVVVYPGWKEEYAHLFATCNILIGDEHKDKVKAEVIFLTHNVKKHEWNIANDIAGEGFLWNPDIQEPKTSQYGGENLRYERKQKREWIKEFIKLHDEIIPWNTIRYIF
jgi:spore photoproduct lyase